MKALLIIDMQNDFMEKGALAVPKARSLSPIIKELASSFSLVVATQDWHPLNHKSFVSEHPGKKVGNQVDLHGLLQTLWPVHCVQHSEGAALIRELHEISIDKIIQKGTDPTIDSYSAFYDNAHLKSTGLTSYLKEKGVDELSIVGVATDYCVLHSVLDALHEGFKVSVIKQACKGIHHEEEAFQKMKDAGAQIILH